MFFFFFFIFVSLPLSFVSVSGLVIALLACPLHNNFVFLFPCAIPTEQNDFIYWFSSSVEAVYIDQFHI